MNWADAVTGVRCQSGSFSAVAAVVATVPDSLPSAQGVKQFGSGWKLSVLLADNVLRVFFRRQLVQFLDTGKPTTAARWLVELGNPHLRPHEAMNQRSCPLRGGLDMRQRGIDGLT